MKYHIYRLQDGLISSHSDDDEDLRFVGRDDVQTGNQAIRHNIPREI